METGLRGRTVIVTGAASNIGRGIALAFAGEGSQVVIVDRADQEQARRTAVRAEEVGAEATLLVMADVSREDEVEAVVKQAIQKFGRVDVLVNNVGQPTEVSILEETAETVDKSLDQNLRSTIYCTKAILPHMIEQGGGTIVNISSEAGLKGDAERPVYSACKGGVISLTRAVARDVGKNHIRVNCVCPHAIIPGDVEQDVGEGSIFHPEKGQYRGWVKGIGTPQMEDYIRNLHALKELGRASDIGDAVVFLASDRARFITGQTLAVNGGAYM